MKSFPRLSLSIALVLVGVASTTSALAQTVVEELEALEHQIARAWVQGDRATLDALFADDWAVIDIAGKVRTKAEVFRDMFGPEATPGQRHGDR